MTITIDLPEDTLSALRADADTQGRRAEEVAADLLAKLYLNVEDEVSAVERALRELENGEGSAFEEFEAAFSSRFAERYGPK